MQISILDPLDAVTGVVGEKTLYHLSIDRCIAELCKDTNELRYFLKVLSSPPITAEHVKYRQDVLRDIIGKPGLLERETRLFSTLAEIKREYDIEKRNRLRTSYSSSSAVVTSEAKGVLRTSALTLKRTLMCLKSISDSLTEYRPLSAGLERLRENTCAITGSGGVSELCELCSGFEYFSETEPVNLRVSVGETGRIESCKLINGRYIRITDPDLKKKKPLFGKKEPEEVYPSERLIFNMNPLYEKLLSAPLYELAEMFESIAGQIFAYFLGVERELVFYRLALSYINTLGKKNAPRVFPEFTDGKSTECVNIYDLLLILQSPDISKIAANDYICRNGENTVVFGGNGCGKTVYLRSVGTVQILAQAGLPVPAEKAILCLYGGIMTQFSEEEKEFRSGNEAGRFEQEVREMARMTDSLTDRSLVLLNETFQTTAYDEGARGLYGILKYLSDSGSGWMLVSHIKELTSYLTEGDARVLTFGADHKIV